MRNKFLETGTYLHTRVSASTVEQLNGKFECLKQLEVSQFSNSKKHIRKVEAKLKRFEDFDEKEERRYSLNVHLSCSQDHN